MKGNYEKERSAQILHLIEKELAAARREVEVKEKEKGELDKKVLAAEKEGAVSMSMMHAEMQKLQYNAAGNSPVGKGMASGAGSGGGKGGGESGDILQQMRETHFAEIELLNKQLEALESQVNTRDKNFDLAHKQYDASMALKDDKIEKLQNEILQSEVKRQISIKNIEGALNAQSRHLDEERDTAVMEEMLRMTQVLEKALEDERKAGEARLNASLAQQKDINDKLINELLGAEKSKFGMILEKSRSEEKVRIEQDKVKAKQEDKLRLEAMQDNSMKHLEKDNEMRNERKKNEFLVEGAMREKDKAILEERQLNEVEMEYALKKQKEHYEVIISEMVLKHKLSEEAAVAAAATAAAAVATATAAATAAAAAASKVPTQDRSRELEREKEKEIDIAKEREKLKEREKAKERERELEQTSKPRNVRVCDGMSCDLAVLMVNPSVCNTDNIHRRDLVSSSADSAITSMSSM